MSGTARRGTPRCEEREPDEHQEQADADQEPNLGAGARGLRRTSRSL